MGRTSYDLWSAEAVSANLWRPSRGDCSFCQIPAVFGNRSIVYGCRFQRKLAVRPVSAEFPYWKASCTEVLRYSTHSHDQSDSRILCLGKLLNPGDYMARILIADDRDSMRS